VEIIVVPTREDVGRRAADLLDDLVSQKPAAVLGLATGSSPLATYADLARRVAAGTLSFDQVTGFALDEYVGIDAGHPESYLRVIEREVILPLGMNAGAVRVPDGRARDLEAACRDYDDAIRAAGGIDLQILGIGANGHIGFNEPTSSFGSRTRIKTLSAVTRRDNARFFSEGETVPTHCLTQGLGTISEARRIVLVAHGERKAKAIAAAVEGPVSSMCPGSALQFHPRVTIVVDEAAGSALTQLDYYADIQRLKSQLPRP
jgi:glucosamine-6-phosphate deaminase